MIAYLETYVGASSYSASGPTLSALPPSPTGGYLQNTAYLPFPGWEPHFHTYRCVGVTGADLMLSFDGRTDHLRVPAQGASGILMPIELPISYKSVWVRSISGVTAQVQAGLFTRQ